MWPETYVIDRNGFIRRKFVGATDWSEPRNPQLPEKSLVQPPTASRCYNPVIMTTVDILYRYGTPPTETAVLRACEHQGGLRHPASRV